MKFYTLISAALLIVVQSLGQSKIQPDKYLSAGIEWTQYNPVLLKGSFPPSDNNSEPFTKKTASILFSYTREIKNPHFVDLSLRMKMIQFYVPFSYKRPDFVETSYSLANIPAFDLSISYAYNIEYHRFTLQPKVGLALFISPFSWDTTDFVEFGNTEFAYGYFDNNLKIGYTAGLNLNYKLSKRFYLGLDANYLASFNCDYSYFHRERLRHVNDPDLTYGLKLKNLHVGFHLGLQLGKSKHLQKTPASVERVLN